MKKNPMSLRECLRSFMAFPPSSQYWPIWLLLTSLCLPACTYDTLQVTPECPEDIQLEIVEIQASTCDQIIGLIEIKANNIDDPELEFSINGTSFQSDGRFENLPAGTYTLTARTALCESTATVQIENETGLNATLITSPSACDQASGAINISVNDATGQVEYKLDGGSAQASSSFTNLPPGDYNISISDESGCEITLEATISSTISYANIETIISNSCAVSGCHAGNVSPDFRVKNNILNNANAIKSRTGSQSMPPSSSGITLTPNEIDAIACWVDDGAQG